MKILVLGAITATAKFSHTFQTLHKNCSKWVRMYKCQPFVYSREIYFKAQEYKQQNCAIYLYCKLQKYKCCL